MNTKARKRLTMLVLLSAIMLLLAGCGGGDPSDFLSDKELIEVIPEEYLQFSLETDEVPETKVEASDIQSSITIEERSRYYKQGETKYERENVSFHILLENTFYQEDKWLSGIMVYNEDIKEWEFTNPSVRVNDLKFLDYDEESLKQHCLTSIEQKYPNADPVLKETLKEDEYRKIAYLYKGMIPYEYFDLYTDSRYYFQFQNNGWKKLYTDGHCCMQLKDSMIGTWSGTDEKYGVQVDLTITDLVKIEDSTDNYTDAQIIGTLKTTGTDPNSPLREFHTSYEFPEDYDQFQYQHSSECILLKEVKYYEQLSLQFHKDKVLAFIHFMDGDSVVELKKQ